MSVLFVALGIYDVEGGVERFNRRVVRALITLGQSGLIDQSSVMSLWDRPHAIANESNVRYWGGSRSKAKTMLRFVREVRRKPSTIVLGHFLLLPLAVVARVLSPRSRILLIIHGVEVWGYQSRVRRWIAGTFVDRFVSVSKYTALRAGRRLGLTQERFVHLPNAIDVLPQRQQERDEHHPPTLISVSRLSEVDRYKNIDLVIEALPSVRRQLGHVLYHVVGDGPLLSKLRRQAQALGVAKSICFHGWVSDEVKDHLYQEADVFVLPSMKEGFGIVFLEAWNHGVPPIAAPYGGVSELINHGEDGYLVDPHPPAIAAAICRLLTDTDLRTTLATRGHQRVLTAFSAEAFVRHLASILVVQ